MPNSSKTVTFNTSKDVIINSHNVAFTAISPSNTTSQAFDEEILRVVRLTDHAKLPTRGSSGAAGFDLYSAYDYLVPSRGKVLVKTDLQLEIPKGYYGRIAPRSGLALKHFLDVGAGVLDADYRGNVGIVLFNFSNTDYHVKVGDRIAQLLVEKICIPEVRECLALEDTERADKGFGSTDISEVNQSLPHVKMTDVDQSTSSDSDVTKSIHTEQDITTSTLPEEEDIDLYMTQGKAYLLNASIGYIETQVLIDSGAQCGIMPKTFYNNLPHKYEKIATATIHGLNGDSKAFKVKVPLQIGSKSYSWPFYVVPHDSPIILGWEFMKSTNCIIDFQSNGIVLDGEQFPLKTLVKNRKHVELAKVKVSKVQCIPPNSAAYLRVKFDRPLGKHKDFLIEATSCKTKALLGNTLVKGGRFAYVSVINDTDQSVKFSKNQHLGIATEIVEIAPEFDGEQFTFDPITKTWHFNPADCYSKDCDTDVYHSCPQEMDTSTQKAPQENFNPSSNEPQYSQYPSKEIPGKFNIVEAILQDHIQDDMTPTEWEDKLSEVSATIPDHIRKLYVDGCEHLDVIESTKLGLVLNAFADVFSEHDFDIGCFKGVTHEINTGDNPPVKQKLRRSIKALQMNEKEHLDNLTSHDIIEPSASEWASPPLMVAKPDGSIRYCIDYRELNKRTVKDSYPLPNIAECMDTLAGNVYFSTLDMLSGYYQILISEKDKHKTSFLTRYGLYQFKRLPMGCCNAPATFQRAMNLMLRGLTYISVLAYLDDILVLGKTFDEHLTNLAEVLSRFRAFNVKLKPRKCCLFRKETKFLGRVISVNGISIDPEKVEVVRNWSIPETKKQLQMFLGFANYHRDHIDHYADISAPLYQLTQVKTPFVWTNTHTESLVALKEAVITAPCLSYPQDEGHYILDTDASHIAIAGCLYQMQNGQEKPIAFSSHTLLPEQKRYCTTRKELLAVVRYTRHFRNYLLCRPFTVRTDHNSLVWLTTFKQAEGQLARWMEELAQFDMKIVHRKGIKHTNADALSRAYKDDQCQEYLIGLTPDQLPCHPCHYCTRAHQKWHDFIENVDNVIPFGKRQLNAKRCHRKTKEKVNIYDHLEDSHILTLYSENLEQFETVLLEETTPAVDDQRTSISDDCQAFSVANTSLTMASINDQSRSLTAQASSKNDSATSQAEDDQQINWLHQYDAETLQKAQEEDPSVNKVIKWLQSGESPLQNDIFSQSFTTKSLWKNRALLEQKNGVLHYRWIDPYTSDRLLFVVPKLFKKEVLFLCHSSRIAGHLGIEKTTEKCRQKFYWPGMTKDIALYVKGCAVCNRSKHSVRHPKANMKLYHAGQPIERVHIDFLGPFVVSSQNNRYILVISDQFSKWVECIPLPNQTASTVAYHLFKHFIANFGCPYYLHSDQGRQFESSLFTSLCQLLEIVKTRTTPYHPQSNAECESKNRLILQLIRVYVEGKATDWDWYLPFLNFTLHTTVNRTTGFTPAMLLFGRELTMPFDLLFDCSPPKSTQYTPEEWAQKITDTIAECHEYARSFMNTAQLRQKNQYDMTSKETKYKVGDYVLKREYSTKRGSKALGPLWSGPWLVVEAHPPIYSVEAKKSLMTLHHDRLKRCTDQNIPNYLKERRKELLPDQTVSDDSDEDFLPPTAMKPPAVETPKPLFAKPVQGKSRDINHPIDDIEIDTEHSVHDLGSLFAPVRTRFGRQTKIPDRLQYHQF